MCSVMIMQRREVQRVTHLVASRHIGATCVLRKEGRKEG